MNLNITGKEKLVLIVGSAPSAETWIEKYRDQLRFFDELVTINNSWWLLRNIQKVWYVASDFLGVSQRLGIHFPTSQDMKLIEQRDHFFHYQQPYSYNPAGGTCMFLNVLYQTINRHFLHPTGVVAGIVGCDCDYTDRKTHFYGTGKMTKQTITQIHKNIPRFDGKAADPVRFGEKWLTDRCRTAMYACPAIKLVNLSEHPRSLLPFPRISCQELIKEQIRT